LIFIKNQFSQNYPIAKFGISMISKKIKNWNFDISKNPEKHEMSKKCNFCKNFLSTADQSRHNCYCLVIRHPPVQCAGLRSFACYLACQITQILHVNETCKIDFCRTIDNHEVHRSELSSTNKNQFQKNFFWK
jgi:hypothetical protein